MKNKVIGILVLGLFSLLGWGIWDFYQYDKFCNQMKNLEHPDCIYEDEHGNKENYWGGEVREAHASTPKALPEGWTVELNEVHGNYRWCKPSGFCTNARYWTYGQAVDDAISHEGYERRLLVEKWRKVS